MIISDVNTIGTSSIVVTIYRDNAYLHLSGPFDGNTVQVQKLLEDGTWADIAGAAYTAPAQEVLELGKNCQLRTVTSGTGSSSIKAEIR